LTDEQIAEISFFIGLSRVSEELVDSSLQNNIKCYVDNPAPAVSDFLIYT